MNCLSFILHPDDMTRSYRKIYLTLFTPQAGATYYTYPLTQTLTHSIFHDRLHWIGKK